MTDSVTQTAPTQAVQPAQQNQEQNSPTQTWTDGFDPETVGYLQNKNWDNPKQVLEAYRSLERVFNTPPDQVVKLPKSPDDKDAWGAVYQRLGRPEAPDKYGDVKVGEGIELNSELLKTFDSTFFDLGLTKAQRDGIVSYYSQIEQTKLKEADALVQQEITSQINQLKKDWGAKYDERVELSKRAFRSFLPDGVDKDQMSAALEGALGVAVTAKLFANIADRLAEDKFNDGMATNGQPRYGYTKEQAVHDKAALMSEIGVDRERLSNYNKGKGPDYDKMQRLIKFIAEN